MLRAKFAALVLTTVCCVSARAETNSSAPCEPTAEASRNLVLSFYKQALIDKRPRAAFEQYVSPDFIEHKPDVPAGGRDAVADFLEGLVNELPEARWEILRTVAEEDFVFLHARFTPASGAPPYAIADLFRIADCAIVEHWDVVGPPREGQPNSNSRF
jgi:predicted SnoaL-like aldol condensation-catalyzing enzyme